MWQCLENGGGNRSMDSCACLLLMGLVTDERWRVDIIQCLYSLSNQTPYFNHNSYVTSHFEIHGMTSTKLNGTY